MAEYISIIINNRNDWVKQPLSEQESTCSNPGNSSSTGTEHEGLVNVDNRFGDTVLRKVAIEARETPVGYARLPDRSTSNPKSKMASTSACSSAQ